MAPKHPLFNEQPLRLGDASCAVAVGVGCFTSSQVQLPLGKKKTYVHGCDSEIVILSWKKFIYLESLKNGTLWSDGMKQIDVQIKFEVERGRMKGRKKERTERKKERKERKKDSTTRNQERKKNPRKTRRFAGSQTASGGGG